MRTHRHISAARRLPPALASSPVRVGGDVENLRLPLQVVLPDETRLAFEVTTDPLKHLPCTGGRSGQ